MQRRYLWSLSISGLSMTVSYIIVRAAVIYVNPASGDSNNAFSMWGHQHRVLA